MRTVDRVMVKGKKEAIEIIEIFEVDGPQQREAKLSSRAAFDKAMGLYTLGHFGRAARVFEGILATNPIDGAAALLSKRCRQLQSKGKPKDWLGVVSMEK